MGSSSPVRTGGWTGRPANKTKKINRCALIAHMTAARASRVIQPLEGNQILLDRAGYF